MFALRQLFGIVGRGQTGADFTRVAPNDLRHLLDFKEDYNENKNEQERPNGSLLDVLFLQVHLSDEL